MNDPQPLRFDDFELDEANAQLTRAGAAISLPPKAFSLLCALARSGGKLATKDSLLDAVWGHRFVSESVLKTTIAQVRAALDDDAAKPRYIETVARRGYRFIGRLTAAVGAPLAAAGLIATPARTGHSSAQPQTLALMVGRDAAMAHLRASWQRANDGQRQLVWIAGDAGIGKSTLIDHFAAEIGADAVAYGQCIEQFGAGEPYLPVLEALKALARRTPDIVPLMRQVAPMWLVQMPWLVTDADRAALQSTFTGTGQERMVRELFELLERYTQDRPLLLVTEDLHWSDQGTLRLMDHFARRRSHMRLMWLASFRLTQIIAEDHPLHQLRQELQLHRLSEELLLDPFSESELAEYVAERMPGKVVAESFIRTLHRHTDGLPLFVVSVLESLLAGEVRDADWSGTSMALPVPDSLAGAVEKQLAKLPSAERATLEAASVCGMEFRAATAAYLLNVDAEEVAAVCDDLVRRQYWLRETGIVDLPDGSIDSRYVFRHAVYKHVFYQRMGTAQRVAFHRRAARSLERAGVSGTPATPGELASHYELGHEYRAAVTNYSAAADNALAHVAPQEALELAEQGLELLPKCAADARDELEFPLRAAYGSASALIRGIAVPETLAAFERVTELYDRLPQTPERALLLNAIAWGRFTRADHEGVFALTKRIHALAEQADDPVLHVFGYNVEAVTLHNLGRYAEALDAMHKGIALLDRHSERVGTVPFYVDPEASMCANVALPMVQMGFADQARAMRLRALRRAEELQQPLAHLVAHWCSCALGVRIDDPAMVEHGAKGLEELIAKMTVQQGLAPARFFRGWAEIRRGNVESGIETVLDGERMYTEAGTFSSRTETLGYAVEGYVLLERWDEAQALLDKAKAFTETSGENVFFGELNLLRARVAMGRSDRAGAHRAVEAALAEAAEHRALGVELKAAVALAELPNATKKDLDILRSTYARLTEGLDTRAAVRARELLSIA